MSNDPKFEETEPVEFEDTMPLESELPSFEETDPSPTAEGAMGAMGLGAVEGVPFAKDVLSAGEALFEDAEFGEAFNSNKQEWDEMINEAEEAHPVAFNVGDIGANIALGALPGGKALSTMKGAMAFGAASSLSRSEDRDYLDAFSGVLIGAGGHTVGKALGMAVDSISGAFGVMGRAGVPEVAGGLSDAARTRFNKHAVNNYLKPNGNIQSAVRDMADDVLNGIADDGMPVLKSAIQGPFETSKRASQAKMRIGKKIGDILNKADDTNIVVKGKDVYNKLIMNMGIDDASIDASESVLMKDSLSKLRKMVDNEFIDSFKDGAKIKSIKGPHPELVGVEVTEDIFEKVPVFKDRTPKQLHQLKVELGEFLGKKVEKAKYNLGSSSIEEETLLTQLGTLSDVLGDTIENSGITSKNTFKNLNRQWNTLRVTEEIAMNNAQKSAAGPFKALQDIISTKGLIIGGMTHAAGLSKAASATIGLSFNSIIKSPKTPAALAKTLLKVGEAIKGNPDHHFTKRIIQAAALGSDKLRLAIESAEAELDLTSSPDRKLQRTTDSLLNNSDQVLSILEYHTPELAKQLRNLIKSENYDAIGPIMEQAADSEIAAKVIQDGVGWDGKVYSEEKKQMLAGEVERMDISRLQKSKLKKELFQQGIVPQIQQEPERFFKARTRDKTKPQY